MADTEWIENIRKIALGAVEAGAPCDILPGSVGRINPLEIQINQKLTLYERQLIVPQHLTDREVVMVIPEMGEARVTVKEGLKAGEQVLLVQKRGGQQYVVIARW